MLSKAFLEMDADDNTDYDNSDYEFNFDEAITESEPDDVDTNDELSGVESEDDNDSLLSDISIDNIIDNIDSGDDDNIEDISSYSEDPEITDDIPDDTSIEDSEDPAESESDNTDEEDTKVNLEFDAIVARFRSRIFQEEDEVKTETESDTEDATSDNTKEDTSTDTNDTDDNDSEKTEDTSTDESSETTETTDDVDTDDAIDVEVDVTSFGTDDTDVQNEYDQNDITILNKLIASESEAINDYFDGSKDTKDENLRTLYSDIGHEERFHLEQLMYAKSQLTGEKYEPRDPKVKSEYDELINGGMDEDTAALTAIDKASMISEDDGDDSDMEELEQETALVYNMLYQNEIMTSICEQYAINKNSIDNNIGVFVEAYIMEAIDNVSSAPKELTKIKSPFEILASGLKMALTGLTKLSSAARDSVRRSKIKSNRRKEWLDKHGIGDLFKGGISLYLYNDRTSSMDLNTPCVYVDFLYRLTKAIGETCGIKLSAAAQHKTITNPIKFKNIDEGMYKLSQVVFTKTKVVVTDKNKDALRNEFFGYSDNKINVNVTHGTDQVVKDSGNIYNRLDAMILVIKKYLEVSEAVLNELSKLEGNVNSVYYKNRPVYNKARENMSKVINKYNQFISAIAHDMTKIMKLDNGLMQMTRERDMTEQGGGTWEGPDVRVNTPQTDQQSSPYIKKSRRSK